MSHPDPLQEHYAEEILDDRTSTRERLEQEIEKTERYLREYVSYSRFYSVDKNRIGRTEYNLRETLARLQDELDELDSD